MFAFEFSAVKLKRKSYKDNILEIIRADSL